NRRGLSARGFGGTSPSENQRNTMRTRLDERTAAVATLVLLGGCLLWSQWPALCAMAERWSHDPRYAHGYFVPMFALALLWLRRGRLAGGVLSPSGGGLGPGVGGWPWWGWGGGGNWGAGFIGSIRSVAWPSCPDWPGSPCCWGAGWPCDGPGPRSRSSRSWSRSPGGWRTRWGRRCSSW